MWIKKQFEMPTGFKWDFYDIPRGGVDILSWKIRVQRFLSKKFKDEWWSNIDWIHYDAPIETFSEENQKVEWMSIRVLAYNYLKTLDDFKDATDEL